MSALKLFRRAVSSRALPPDPPQAFSGEEPDDLQTLREDIVGRGAPLEDGPFGEVPLVYADWTASGRPLQSVEDVIARLAAPWYGNTHTLASAVGLRTTALREEARQLVADAVGADAGEDVVLFAGAGCTGAVDKLTRIMGLHVGSGPQRRPVVFVGPHEHHSNLLPWRESGAEGVNVPETARGDLDLDALEGLLLRYRLRPLKIGSFSAGSNISGILVDADAVSALLHKHGALAFFDYAAVAPYVSMSMAGKDALFFSPHKFVGGPGATGVLVVKRRLLASNQVPAVPGGGTVLMVTDEDAVYLSNLAEREEGGTPDILGCMRAGLALRVKERLGGGAHTEPLEAAVWARVRAALGAEERVQIVGGLDVARVPIVSFLVRFDDAFLHYEFVCALLNDLFGVQARGGCQCAGPYGFRTLDISPAETLALQDALVDGFVGVKPGYTRVGFPYFMSDAEIDYVVDAILLVARHGWRLLPQYRMDPRSGRWVHRSGRFASASGGAGVSLARALDEGVAQPAAPLSDVAMAEAMAAAKGRAEAVLGAATAVSSGGASSSESDEELHPQAFHVAAAEANRLLAAVHDDEPGVMVMPRLRPLREGLPFRVHKYISS